MKSSAVFLLLLYVPLLISARHITRSHYLLEKTKDEIPVGRPNVKWEQSRRQMTKLGKAEETVEEVAGSRLPDCSHACGSCSPCRLVMISFVCASLQEAETCPMTYKCMCHNKSYPVP